MRRATKLIVHVRVAISAGCLFALVLHVYSLSSFYLTTTTPPVFSLLMEKYITVTKSASSLRASREKKDKEDRKYSPYASSSRDATPKPGANMPEEIKKYVVSLKFSSLVLGRC